MIPAMCIVETRSLNSVLGEVEASSEIITSTRMPVVLLSPTGKGDCDVGVLGTPNMHSCLGLDNDASSVRIISHIHIRYRCD